MRLYPRSSRLRAWPLLAVIGAGLLLALPAAAGGDFPAKKSRLSHFSQSVAFHYWLANPGQAPAQLKSPLARVSKAAKAARS